MLGRAANTLSNKRKQDDLSPEAGMGAASTSSLPPPPRKKTSSSSLDKPKTGENTSVVYVKRRPVVSRTDPSFGAPPNRQGPFVAEPNPPPPPTLNYRSSDSSFKIRALTDQVKTLTEDLQFANNTARVREEQLARLRQLHAQEIEQYEARIAELEALVAELKRGQRPARDQGGRRGN